MLKWAKKSLEKLQPEDLPCVIQALEVVFVLGVKTIGGKSSSISAIKLILQGYHGINHNSDPITVDAIREILSLVETVVTTKDATLTSICLVVLSLIWSTTETSHQREVITVWAESVPAVNYAFTQFRDYLN